MRTQKQEVLDLKIEVDHGLLNILETLYKWDKILLS